MNEDIRCYTKILEERISQIERADGSYAVDDLIDECDSLVEISDHLVRTKKLPQDDVKAFISQKRRLRSYKKAGKDKEGHSRLMELRPLLERSSVSDSGYQSSAGFVLMDFHKKLALENIRNKVEEITDLNTYIDTVVELQGEGIDNIVHQMRHDAEMSKQTVDQLGSALRHRRGRNKVYNFVLISFFFMVVFLLMLRVVLRA